MSTYVIVGGVAGGASTAARLRRLDENAEIILLEKGSYVSFANCGLPYYIGGVIQERDALLLQTPEKLNARFKIDVRINSEVIKVVPEENKVVVKEKDGNEYDLSYTKLVLSPGSTPLFPPIKGIESDRIFKLWNIPDTDKIKNFIESEKPRSTVVVGGGFIGVEIAENLLEYGIDVHLVEMQNQIMGPFDYEMAHMIHMELVEQGINLHLEKKVEEFTESETVEVKLSTGESIKTDFVIMSLGVRPNTSFLKESSIQLNDRGAIVVDEYMRTNHENIFAVGDAVEIKHFVDGEKTTIPLAGPANKQGRMVAGNLLGAKLESYKGTQGTSIVKIFDLTCASTGYNEKQLKAKGKKFNEDYLISLVQANSHATYYPGAMGLTLKVIFDKKSHLILGAQIVGYKGVDKRIDVISTAMRLGAKVTDLKELELAYSPVYSSAKDPVNMVGYVAENIIEGLVEATFMSMIDTNNKDTVILDVRDEVERDLGFIHNSVNIPVNELRSRTHELDKGKEYIVYCAVGIRGYIAARILTHNGFKVKNLSGGYSCYATYTCNLDDLECLSNRKSYKYEDSGDVNVVVREEKMEILNVCAQQCPGPILSVSKKLETMEDGDVLEIHATDPGFLRDIGAWCKSTKNTLLNAEKSNGEIVAVIKKGLENKSRPMNVGEIPHDKTIVVFSGDLDKAIASLIIANGAASMGRKVTMFYTFWGLNVLRRHEKVSVKKNFIQKMFAGMMPRGTKKLGLSKMNFMGAGAKMIRKIMKDNNVNQLEELLQTALDSGVKMIACNMSMDLMGITEAELIDGIELGGVASYLSEAEQSDTNLFI